VGRLIWKAVDGQARREGALILLAALLLADAAAATQTNEYQCRREGLIRRVQLGGGTDGAAVPCEVVYWKDSEQPGVGQILWNAVTDARYCEQKARGLVEQLSGRGWQCERLGEAAQRRLTSPVRAPERPAAWSSARRRAPASPLDPAALAEVIGHTLDSLRDLHPGRFDAEIADYGDLNGDGFEDAVVVITYRATDRDKAQYLVVYLFDGEGYRAVASRSISGPPDDAAPGAIERIVDGAILVERSAVETAESACCGSRPAAFVLREGKLVRLD
jgi:hypothetical protein